MFRTPVTSFGCSSIRRSTHWQQPPAMNAVEIEEAVSELASAPFDAAEFPFRFLAAFGRKDVTIKGSGPESDAGVARTEQEDLSAFPSDNPDVRLSIGRCCC
jgi:hypothetical protein